MKQNKCHAKDSTVDGKNAARFFTATGLAAGALTPTAMHFLFFAIRSDLARIDVDKNKPHRTALGAGKNTARPLPRRLDTQGKQARQQPTQSMASRRRASRRLLGND